MSDRDDSGIDEDNSETSRSTVARISLRSNLCHRRAIRANSTVDGQMVVMSSQFHLLVRRQESGVQFKGEKTHTTLCTIIDPHRFK